MNDLHTLTATEAASAIRQGAITSEELVAACLNRVDSREDIIQAWAYVDREGALAAAMACDAADPVGPLHGVPVGVKDVIDTATMPTTYGSKIHASHRPLRDAACVLLLQRAGAVIVGKTVTTEFAMYEPSKTLNPHAVERTPGGSSSGSAAAVADMHVPIALGTQTSESIIRPAAFCGTIGFKPSYGSYPVEGIKALGSTLDTLGALTRCVDDLSLLHQVFTGDQLLQDGTARSALSLKLGVWLPPFGSPATDEDGLAMAIGKLRAAGVGVEPINLPASFNELNEVHAELMAYEVVRNHVYECEPEREKLLGPRTKEVFDQGRAVSHEQYLVCRKARREALAAFNEAVANFDAILVPAARGEAPLRSNGTGDPVFNRVWSLLGVPALALPVGLGQHDMPLAVQLVGCLDSDRRLVSAAQALECLLSH